MARLTIDDLDIERDGEPFEVEMGDGEVFRMLDPKAVSGKELVRLEGLSSEGQLKATLGERADALLDYDEVDGYFMQALMAKWRKHYGIPTPPEARGSRTSSKGTASTSKRTSPRGVSR